VSAIVCCCATLRVDERWSTLNIEALGERFSF
jgi:hypothetical protein